MSPFDPGFMFWGYFLLYALLVAAYYAWMAVINRRERQRVETAPAPASNAHATVATPQGEQQR